MKDDYAVIIIDNSDIAKPASKKMEVLSEKGKMPLPVYEKVFSAAQKGFIRETYENLCCLESLSENFTSKCVRTPDRGSDANEYYHYFLKHGERFIIRAKRNRNVIYNGHTCNIMDVALRYKGAYRMDFKDKKAGVSSTKCATCLYGSVNSHPKSWC